MHLHVIADALFKTGVETQDLGLERTLETRKSKLLPTAGTLPLKTNGHSTFESSPRSGTLFGGLTFSTSASSEGDSESALQQRPTASQGAVWNNGKDTGHRARENGVQVPGIPFT